MAKKRYAKKKGVSKKSDLSKKVPISKNINSEAIAAALSTTNQPVLLKVCRLCETKDGPFLNIFDIDKIIAKKIEDVMPFAVAENDDLPHKICFRCSAKVEELYEFIQKCVKTQINLRKAIGEKAPRKLNESNISNDDICDALIKKAMENITFSNKDSEKDIKEKSRVTFSKPSTKCDTNNIKVEESNVDDSDIPLKKVKLQTKKKCGPNKGVSSLNEENTKNVETTARTNAIDVINVEDNSTKSSETPKVNTSSLESTSVPEEPLKPFNIMDHVSMIKVNGVGVLFQCKLCNRNFLKREVVVSHGCAKNGGTKKIESKKDPPKLQEPPKMPTVKYINTKVHNEPKKPIVVDEPITLDDDDEDDKPLKPQTGKPKIGPASKVKKTNANSSLDSDVFLAHLQVGQNSNPTSQTPIVQFPSIPSANSRYKLVPGPNNTFTLIEEGADNSINSPQKPVNATSIIPPRIHIPETIKETKSDDKTKVSRNAGAVAPAITQEDAVGKPYPVGLFQTVPHNSNPNNPSEPPSFTTPAMKKQSYTVVQTGNPSKLLISTKPQPPEQTVTKRKPRKVKNETKSEEPIKQPFSVTLEDTAPQRDTGFFTFINVDPLLQPSYVLPTDSIIQESQITTSTNAGVNQAAQDNNKDLRYTCNMCNEKFTREKKLLTHIQSHYSKMDEEDQLRLGNNFRLAKKRSRQAKK